MTDRAEHSQINNNDYTNTFKILLATDNHIGYLEDDPIRGRDSFDTFEEILKLAKQHEVDFILLGGDLFHHNRPSRSCLYQTMRLLRRYCMGDKPSELWISSDPSVHFADDFATANYLDPNYNVSYPVFSIHGNHDDPNGSSNLCSLQLLSTCGLMNYFGRINDIQNVTIQPILLEKGTSKLALYGLGNIRDERLHRTWRDGRVNFDRPLEPDWRDEAFNLFVIHQNRAKRGPTSYIPEPYLDNFLDLVLWGHEHDCRIDPESNGVPGGPLIIQPGSSVATSLSEGEAIKKHVGILEVTGRDYVFKKIKLTTIRPFQCTSIILHQDTDFLPTDKKACQRYLHQVVNDLIEKAKEDWKEQLIERQQRQSEISQLLDHEENENHHLNKMPLPLIRVRVDYTDAYTIFNPLQFGQQFINQVANPKDMIKFRRIKEEEINTRGGKSSSSRNGRTRAVDILDDLNTPGSERLEQIKVEDLANDFLTAELAILPENELIDTIKQFVDKEDKTAIKRFVTGSVTHIQRNIPPSMDYDSLTDEFVNRRVTTLKNERSLIFARDHLGLPSQQQQSQSQSSSFSQQQQYQQQQEINNENIDNYQMGDTNTALLQNRENHNENNNRKTNSAQRERVHNNNNNNNDDEDEEDNDVNPFSADIINKNTDHENNDDTIQLDLTNKKKEKKKSTHPISISNTKPTHQKKKSMIVNISDDDDDEDEDGTYVNVDDNDNDEDNEPTTSVNTNRKRTTLLSSSSLRTKKVRQESSNDKGKKKVPFMEDLSDERNTTMLHGNTTNTQRKRKATPDLSHQINDNRISSSDEDMFIFDSPSLPSTQPRRKLPSSHSQLRKN